MARRIELTVTIAAQTGLFLLCFVLTASSWPGPQTRAVNTAITPEHTAVSQSAALLPSPSACAPECGQPGAGALSAVRMKATAIYSFPGSGNTWLRHMLTTATGILTGVVYMSDIDVDTVGNQNNWVLGTKTHKSPVETKRSVPYERTLLLIRNPYDVFLAKFNRKGDFGTDDKISKATGVRPIEDFKKDWPKYPLRWLAIWRQQYILWSKEPTPTHVLVFNRLQANVGKELRDVLTFFNESSIVPKIHCAVENSEGHAHRQKPLWQQELTLYSKEMKAVINRGIDEVQEALEAKTGQSFHDFQQWKQ